MQVLEVKAINIAARYSMSFSVTLPTAECTDWDLRLRDGPIGRNSSGRLEICYNETWSTVCDGGWGMPDVSVACKQLGYSRLGEELLEKEASQELS
jgi:hypothetical protein